MPLVQEKLRVDKLEAWIQLATVSSLAQKFRCVLWLEKECEKKFDSEKIKILYNNRENWTAIFSELEQEREENKHIRDRQYAKLLNHIRKIQRETHKKLVSGAFEMDKKIEDIKLKKKKHILEKATT